MTGKTSGQIQAHFPAPVLICDIGGTNCRFAIVEKAGLVPEFLATLPTDQYPSFRDAIHAMSVRHAVNPASLVVCAAGPLRGRSVALTNAGWSFDGATLAQDLDLQQGLLLNDFEAQALSLPVLRRDWVRPIGSCAAPAQGPRMILGPGTGLGMATLLEHEGAFLPIPSEAGHTDFAAADAGEGAIWDKLRQHHARVTPETLLSGAGLARLHAARQALAAGDAYVEEGNGYLDAATITRLALADPQSVQADTIRHFWKLVARFAGDMVLILLARGGMTLAGGILPRIAPLLDDSLFRAAFESKSPMEHVVRSVPVQLLTHPEAVLHGMAALAHRPALYRLDYTSRLWR